MGAAVVGKILITLRDIGNIDVTRGYDRGDSGNYNNSTYVAVRDIVANESPPHLTDDQDRWMLLSNGAGETPVANGAILYYTGSELRTLAPVNNTFLAVSSAGLPAFQTVSTVSTEVRLYQNTINAVPNASPHMMSSLPLLSNGRILVAGHSFFGCDGEAANPRNSISNRYGPGSSIYTGISFHNKPYYRQLCTYEGDVKFEKLFFGAKCYFAIGEDATQVYGWGYRAGRFDDGEAVFSTVGYRRASSWYIFPRRVAYFNDNNIRINKVFTPNSWGSIYNATGSISQDIFHHDTNLFPQIGTETGASSSYSNFTNDGVATATVNIAYYIESTTDGGQGRVFMSGDGLPASAMTDDQTLAGAVVQFSGLTNVTDGFAIRTDEVFFIIGNSHIVRTSNTLTGSTNFETVYDFGSGRAITDIQIANAPFSGATETTRRRIIIVTLDNGTTWWLLGNGELVDFAHITSGSRTQILPPSGKTIQQVIYQGDLSWPAGSDFNHQDACILGVMTDGTLYWKGRSSLLGDTGSNNDLHVTDWQRLAMPVDADGNEMTVKKVKPTVKLRNNTGSASAPVGFHILIDGAGAGDRLLYVGKHPRYHGVGSTSIASSVTQSVSDSVQTSFAAFTMSFYLVDGYVGKVMDWDYVMADKRLRIHTQDGRYYMSQPNIIYTNASTYATDTNERHTYSCGINVRERARDEADNDQTPGTLLLPNGMQVRRYMPSAPILPRTIEVR